MCCSPSGRDTRSRVSFLESQECPENGKYKIITLFQEIYLQDFIEPDKVDRVILP